VDRDGFRNFNVNGQVETNLWLKECLMKIAVALVITYLIAGIAYVAGEVREPVIRQPCYAREYRLRRRVGPLVAAALTWMPLAVARRRWVIILLFVIATAIGGTIAR
jgi:hypothetical protein